MEIIIWILSLIIFSWCYSTIFACLFNLKVAPNIKISLIIYLIILVILYVIAYFLLNKYFISILICSGIAGLLGLLTARKQ